MKKSFSPPPPLIPPTNHSLSNDHSENGVAATAVVIDDGGGSGSPLVADVQPRLNVGEALDDVGGEAIYEGTHAWMFSYSQLWLVLLWGDWFVVVLGLFVGVVFCGCLVWCGGFDGFCG